MGIGLVAAAAAGVVAGVVWHARILSAFTAGGEPSETGAAGPSAPRQLWTCGMHPQVIQDRPGKCPICHMKLTPIKADSAAAAAPQSATAAVVIDPVVVQNMGVRTAAVSEGPLKRTVRLVGYLDEAQPNVRDINLRVSGWVRRLHVSTEGQHVEAGDPLFDLYSPELQVAIGELIAARRARAAAGQHPGSGEVAGTLYDAAASKLVLLGLDSRQVEALAKLEQPPEAITFISPISGDVMEKLIVEGAAVRSGERVLRIVDRSMLWLDAQVFEKDLPFVQIGQGAVASIASRSNETIVGKIAFIQPRLSETTRTTTVRLEIANPTLALKPGMYAIVRVESQIAERAVLAPREAIIDTGESQVAFVAAAAGRFEPRKVRMGPPAENGMVQVLEGLAPGEPVVTSGQFLIDSESRLREAIQKFLSQSGGQASAGADPGTVTAARAEVSPERQQKADALFKEYLRLSSALGAMDEKEPAIDPRGLIGAAHSLHAQVSGTPHEPIVAAVATAAEALQHQSLEKQRELFSPLSERVIALMDAIRPTSAVGGDLYLMNCPMAPGGGKGDWVQSSPDLANPFYGADMKKCGSPVRTITTRGK
jgi:RND family efflux transporter MFP subunit